MSSNPQLQSHNQPPRSFSLPKNFKPNPVKLDNLELLKGHSNYEEWVSQNEHDILCYEGYEALSDHALRILIQVISIL